MWRLRQLLRHPDNRETPIETLSELMESLRQHGQLVPLIIGPSLDPSRLDCRTIYDGHRRAAAMMALGMEAALAIELDHAPDEIEAITIRVVTAMHSQCPDKAQIAGDVWLWREKTGKGATEAAQHFSISQGYCSKLCRPYEDGIAALIEALRAREIAPTCAYLIAQLPPEAQARALPRCLGKKRAAVERICAEYRPRKARQKPLTLKLSDASMTFAAPTVEAVKAAHARLGELLAAFEAGGYEPDCFSEVIPALLKSARPASKKRA